MRKSTFSLCLLLAASCLPASAADPPELVWKRDVGYSRVLTAGPIGTKNRMAIVAVTDGGAVYALAPKDGATLWRFAAQQRVSGCPALADVDADGANEVVVGSYDANLYVLSGDDGRIKWRFRTGGEIRGAPVVARLSRKNRFPEVVVANRLGEVICLRGDGKSAQWVKNLPQPVSASPAVADINGDGQLDVVVVSDGGDIVVLEGYSGVELAQFTSQGARDTSPVLIDLNRNRKSEILIAATRLQAFGESRGGWTQFWSYNDGDQRFTSSPALGDLEGDGSLEAVAVTRDGYLHCVSAESGKPKWKTRIAEGGGVPSASPIVADLLGTRKGQIIVSTPEGKLIAVSGDDGRKLWEINLQGYADTSPVVLSTDQGKTLLIIASEAATQTVRAYRAQGGGQIFWGKANGDAGNTAWFPNALAYGNVLRGITEPTPSSSKNPTPGPSPTGGRK